MVTLVLAFLIAALRERHWLALACLVLATLTKETAVCAPLLLVLLTMMRPVGRRTIVLALAWCVVFAAARLYFKPAEGLLDPIDGYFVKQFLVGVYGTLAMPWTREQMFAYPWLMSIIVVTLGAVAALAIGRMRDRALWTRIAIWAAWALIAALPVYRYFHIAPDLQGSRYLYLPAVGWSILIASVASRERRVVGQAIVGVLVVTGVVGTFVQQQRWREAANYRDATLARAEAQARAESCRNPEFRRGPDAHAGVYVFRNGMREAAIRAGITDPTVTADCVFDWENEDFVRKR